MGCVRFQIASQNCLAFMSSVLAEDIYGVWTRCQSNTDLLKVHPLYLLAFVYEQRYHTWADWAASLWNQVAEIETATNMTSPTWKREVEVDRLRSLSTSGTLLNEVHATHVELSHSDTVLRFGLKMGRYCLDLVAEAENKRQELGFDTLPVWYKSALEARLKYTLTQCESLSDKLLELKNRLSGQIEVSYNLIAQKNSLVNLAVAQKQANDSRAVKAIAVLTLICLPSTLVATLWTAGLFRLEGNTNWQVFIAVSFALTLVVLLCWRLYVLVSERWKQSPDIDHLFIA
ncbi:hypothetical protein HFD88_005968 [Aspergillus terreus]|nr:hypothetical protein HFD88_005968 [Aspergillus terreus]